MRPRRKKPTITIDKNFYQRLNDDIPFPVLTVINDAGERFLNVKKQEALTLAQEAGYDLYLVKNSEKDPIAKFVDYGKLKYGLEKKRKLMKKNQVVVRTKEIRARVNIDFHDVNYKVKNAAGFLRDDKDKVKWVIRLRGRELIRKNDAIQTLNNIYEKLKDVAVIESGPSQPSKFLITMTLAPK